MKKLTKAFLSLFLLSLIFMGVLVAHAEESPYKDYYQSKTQTVNGDFEAFEVGTALSEDQLEGAWGTVTSYDNAAVISEVDGSHVLDLPGGAKKYTSAFLILPDSLDVGTILRVSYDVKFNLTQELSTYEYLDTSLVGGSNVEYYIINLKKVLTAKDPYTTGAETVNRPIQVVAKENGWYNISFDTEITRKDLISANSLRFLAILQSENDHVYFDNVNLYYLTEDAPVQTVDVTSITINDGIQLNLSVGAERKLSYTVNPEDATDKSVSFTSSDASIVSVSNDGTIKALKEGSVVVTIKSSNNIQAQIAIIVANGSDDTPKKGCGSIIGSLPLISISIASLAVLFSAAKIKKNKERD